MPPTHQIFKSQTPIYPKLTFFFHIGKPKTLSSSRTCFNTQTNPFVLKYLAPQFIARVAFYIQPHVARVV